MNYWTDIFSPETYEAFGRSDRTITGFRVSQRSMADKVQVGDRLICYMMSVSRWIGVLEVVEGPFIDTKPIFVPDDDPFPLRFKVKCLVWLPTKQTVPIHTQPEVFSRLTFTREVKPGGYWLGPLRRSLAKIDSQDGNFLDSFLTKVQTEKRTFPLDEEQYERALKRRIQRPDRSVVVSVPDDGLTDASEPEPSTRDHQSFRMQALLCRIGEAMGFRIWLPIGDRSRVTEYWSPQPDVLLARLPLNYDETTLDTIRRIDVLWLHDEGQDDHPSLRGGAHDRDLLRVAANG